MVEVYFEYIDSESNRVPPNEFGNKEEHISWRAQVRMESFQLFGRTEYAIRIWVHDSIDSDTCFKMWKSMWTLPIEWGSDLATQVRRAIDVFDSECALAKRSWSQDDERAE